MLATLTYKDERKDIASTATPFFGTEKHDDGRLYNSTHDEYVLPADQAEVERLNGQHKALTLVFEGLIPEAIAQGLAAKPQDQLRFLDAGCGTGCWSIEMAERFPAAKVIGADLVTIHPPSHPSNVEFQKIDLLQPFPEEWEGSFDLVHARYLIAGIRDFPALLARLGRLLNPGGNLIVIEPEAAPFTATGDVCQECPGMAQVADAVNKAMRALGLDPRPGQTIPIWLEQTGLFSKTVSKRWSVPMSPWSEDPRLKSIGQAHLANSLALPGAFKRLALSARLIEEGRYDELTKQASHELLEAKKTLLLPVWMTYATRSQ